MRFEWNKRKSEINLKKHGVSFQEAITVFDDPLSDTFDDPDHSSTEQRFLIIGHSQSGRILFVSHTQVSDTIRILSARKPTYKERKQYEEFNR